VEAVKIMISSWRWNRIAICRLFFFLL
jgi:hypothetical protein